MSYDKNKVIALAESEVGYHEKASNAQLDDKTANSGSGNWTKYARDLDALGNFYNGKKNGYAWCDMFYDWLLVKCFGAEAAKKLLCQPDKSAGAGCYYSALYYKQKGQFYTSNPQPGDQIFFTYKAGEVSHTGLVVSVSGSTVNTIEGNTSDGVYRRSYSIGSSSIYGYGRPNWNMDGGTTTTTPPATATKTIDELAQEVIDGKWGNGDARKSALTAAGYDAHAVQTRVNEMMDSKTTTPTTTTPALKAYTITLQQLAKGSEGKAVERVQTLLIARGYSCGGNVVNGVEKPDGDFGTTTDKAVREFQKANGLTVDGVIGASTMSALLK